jgi:hypothetical protein
MYAHVTTYRLGISAEVESDLNRHRPEGDVVSDQTARTIASWWHAPTGCPAITALSHGRSFDTDDLRDEIGREITEPRMREAMLDWLENLEDLLSD